MKIVYITGCLGFIGSYITRACLKKGWYVRGVDKITYAANEDLLQEFCTYKNFFFEKKDINDLSFLYDCDYIINTAAETHVDNSIVSSKDFLHSNIDGVHNLLELMKTKLRYKVPTLLHFSTDEVYGDVEIGAHTEADILKPSNPYSASKAAADMLILAWARTFKLPYVIMRPTNNYGIGQYVEKLIPKACKYISLERKIPLHNNGTPVRTWLHVEDTAAAAIAIIENGVQNEIFNIAGNFEQTNIETIKQIIQFYEPLIENVDQDVLDKYIDFTCHRPGQDVRYALDDTKLQRLGWQPIRIFNSELKKAVEYYKTNFIW
jgi:dTDP-glucose 4,6-dehydratase